MESVPGVNRHCDFWYGEALELLRLQPWNPMSAASTSRRRALPTLLALGAKLALLAR
jgi:hypothetical protein